jgi:hypothetical protein
MPQGEGGQRLHVPPLALANRRSPRPSGLYPGPQSERPARFTSRAFLLLCGFLASVVQSESYLQLIAAHPKGSNVDSCEREVLSATPFGSATGCRLPCVVR